jgi:uncharacterized protein YdhG (YjbR/CyaY superfamily)
VRPVADIDGYLKGVGPVERAALQKLRGTIKSVVPEAQECISYRLPAFRYEGRVIAGFAAGKKRCSYYPFSGRTLTTLKVELAAYSQTKGALHFDPKKGLPKTIVRQLLKARIAEG